MDKQSGIPVMLTVANRRCVVVGGGAVALRRAQALVDAGASVDVYAPKILPEINALGVNAYPKHLDPTDIEGAFLVVIATDDPGANTAIAERASAWGALVNRADDASAGDIQFMASHRDGPLTLAAHTGGASAKAAGRVRDQLVSQLDPDWPRLLKQAKPMRTQIQQQIADPTKRAEMLRRLTDDQAMATLKADGEAALQAFYADIMKGLA